MRVACVVADDFEDIEWEEPVAALKGAGHEVVMITPSEATVLGKQGRARVSPGLVIDDAEPAGFDALFIPGGYSPDRLREDERFLDFVRHFDDEGKPIWSLCHGPQLLLTAGVLEGRVVTAWKTVQDDLARAGIDVRDEEVVEDGPLITSRNPSDLPAFCKAIVKAAERAGEGTRLFNPADSHPLL